MIAAPELIFWNSNSLNSSKLSQLDLYLNSSPNVLAVGVCETRHNPLSASPSDPSRLEMKGFSSYRQPFELNRCGLAFFVHQSIPARPRPDLQQSRHVLFLQCKFPSSQSDCIIGVVYRPHREGHVEWARI